MVIRGVCKRLLDRQTGTSAGHRSPLNAAILGVYLHGLAGDIAADIITPRALIAGDMIECLPEVFELLE